MPACRFIYFAGNDRAGDLAAALGKAGRTVETVVAYRAVIVDDFDAGVRAAIAGGRIDGALHYSARTAGAFIAAAEAAGVTDFAMKIRHFCLSPQVAAPLAAAGAGAVDIARGTERSGPSRPYRSAMKTWQEVPLPGHCVRSMPLDGLESETCHGGQG